MRGYPKHLNTRADYEYVKANFPKDLWVKDFENLLTDTKTFVFVKVLGEGETGIEDASHRIDVTENDGKIERLQYELRDNYNARIYRLGYTPEEIIRELSALED